MKFIKSLSIVMLTLILAACGGHGFEGEYKLDTQNELLNSLVDTVSENKIIIGSNYIDDENGKRTEFNSIFVRESGGNKFLVFEDKSGAEETWKIEDENTLIMKKGFVSIKLIRTP